jgi:NAD-reducing hydrogenase small subunit
MPRVKIATGWLDSCGGCHVSLLDMDERLVELLDQIEITSSPITDLKHPPKAGVDIGILTGAVANTHQLEVAREMRARCKTLVTIGHCAVFPGIPAMRNVFSAEEVLRRGYVETESTVQGEIPASEELARLFGRVKAVHEVVKVDVHLPGCPPSADVIHFVLQELVEGRIPVLSGEYLQYD